MSIVYITEMLRCVNADMLVLSALFGFLHL